MTRTRTDAASTARRIHAERVVFDSTFPLFRVHPARAIEECGAAGTTAVGVTVAAGLLSTATGFDRLVDMHRLLRAHRERVHLVETVDDFTRAKERGKLGVTLHYQNSEQFGHDLDRVGLYYRMGVRVAQLTYNVRNFVGDGCTEPTDAGLSRFGERLVREMNDVGMVVDGSHTGYRTTMDAMAVCEAPFVFSHTGCKAVYDHPRSITDDQIRTCAATGGVVGVYAMPFFVSDDTEATLDHVLRHITHAVELVGVEHVGIGLDYHDWTQPYITPAQWSTKVEEFVELGVWREEDLPLGAWAYAPEIRTPAGMQALTAALLARGFTDDETAGIMGENFVRVFGQVWR